MKSLTALVLLLTLVTPVLASEVHCTTTEDTLLNRLVTVCSDGTRAMSYWDSLLQRWETTVQPAPGTKQPCTAQMNPLTRQIEVRCP